MNIWWEQCRIILKLKKAGLFEWQKFQGVDLGRFETCSEKPNAAFSICDLAPCKLRFKDEKMDPWILTPPRNLTEASSNDEFLWLLFLRTQAFHRPTSEIWVEWARKLAVLPNILYCRKVASVLSYFLQNCGECLNWEVWIPLFPLNNNNNNKAVYFVGVFFKYQVGRRSFQVFPYFVNLQKIELGKDELKIHVSRKMWRSRISGFLAPYKIMSVSQCIYAMLFCIMVHSTFETMQEWTKKWRFLTRNIQATFVR